MKVLFVSSGNSHYGIVPFIKSQGDSLIKEGVDVDFFTVKGKNIGGYVKNIKVLSNYIRLGKFDIIHAHYGLTGLLCVMTFTRIPIILSVMGSDAYGSFNKNGKRIKSSYVNMFLTQIALIFVKKIIVKSKNILKFVPYKDKTIIIPNGVNFEMFKSNNNDLPKNRVLFLGNPSDPRKNIKLLQKAINLINRENLKLINPFPIPHNHFPEYLNNTSVFVLTSYNEGSPNVIKEAMACDVPIVSTDVGDVREVMIRTEGCFISSFEPKDIAQKIKKALDFETRTTGREDIKHLDSCVIAKRIIEIYNEILIE